MSKLHRDLMQKKSKTTVFVVMPFSATPTRDKPSLDHFFEINLKQSIELNNTIENSRLVYRSADRFDITTQIIVDLYDADIVICDLSGEHANPNVMYELGVRLALSNKPVILIREHHPANRQIFDISGFHIFEYSPLRYNELQSFLGAKIQRLEKGEDKFESPVLKSLKASPHLMRAMAEKQANRLLQMGVATMRITLQAATGHIKRFFPEDAELHKSNTLEDVLSNIFDRWDELSQRDWGNFLLKTQKPAVIEMIPLSIDLSAFLPERAAIMMNTFIINYLMYFYGATRDYDEPLEIYSFLWETFQLAFVLGICLSYFDNREDHEKTTTELIGQINKSRLMQMILKNEDANTFDIRRDTVRFGHRSSTRRTGS